MLHIYRAVHDCHKHYNLGNSTRKHNKDNGHIVTTIIKGKLEMGRDHK